MSVPKKHINGHARLKGDKERKKILDEMVTSSLTTQARKNIGKVEDFRTVTEYRMALRAERKKLRAKNNLNLLGETFKGRTPEFRKEFVQAARIVCSLYGSSVEELAKFFGVTTGKIRFWIKEYPEFNKAVNDRSTEINMQIMGRLARRALGFYANTEKIFYDVKRGDVIKVPTKEYFPPSETAIMFWLKNRMPEHWKDTKDVNVDETRRITMEIYKNFEGMTQEQATDAYQELLKVEATVPQIRKGTGPVTDVPVTE